MTAACLTAKRTILLDFDGPVCRLFDGHPAASIADEMRRALAQRGARLSPELLVTPDPLDLLRWAGNHRGDLVKAIERILTAGEVLASVTALPNEHTYELITSVRDDGRRVAIVSNNSHQAVSRYLEGHGIAGYVDAVFCRVPGRPDLMKPNPYAVVRALSAFGVAGEESVLIGDAPADMEAAHSAGVTAVGYARSPERAPGLLQAGADLVTDSMDKVRQLLSGAGLPTPVPQHVLDDV